MILCICLVGFGGALKNEEAEEETTSEDEGALVDLILALVFAIVSGMMFTITTVNM